MATNCEDVSARMVELLYGELPANARSGVDAHVAGCARCRSELEGLQKTRAVTRRALDESPPPRARVEILRRAAEHLAAQQQPAAAAAAAAIAPAVKPRKTAEPERSSLWDWLRSRWTLPSLATVGAVALLVIGSRVLLEPSKIDYKGSPEFQREARQAAAPVTVPAEPAPVPAPPQAEGASFGADKDRTAKPAPAAEPSPEGAGRMRMGSEASAMRDKAKSKAKAEAKPSAAISAPARPSGPVFDLPPADSGRGDKGRFAPPPPPKPVTGFKMEEDAPSAASTPRPSSRRASAPSKDDSADNLLERAEKAPAQAKGSGASANLGGLGADVGGGGKAAEHSLAKERPPQEAPAPRVTATAPAAPPPAAAMQPPPAPAPAAPVRREAQKKAAKRPTTAADEESAAAPEEGKAMAGKTKASAETAVERANRLFTEGRWAEAAAAYRELLRRDPSNAEAGRWRQRLAVAEAALESRRPSEPVQAAPPAR